MVVEKRISAYKAAQTFKISHSTAKMIVKRYKCSKGHPRSEEILLRGSQ
jgi:hypothetical protein